MDTFLTAAKDVSVVQPHAIMAIVVLLRMLVSQHRSQPANHIVLAQPPPPQPLQVRQQPPLFLDVKFVA
jgi:hypothetical protein